MQLKTGPAHPQSWCSSNSVTLLKSDAWRRTEAMPGQIVNTPSIQCNYFIFLLLFYFFEWSLYAFMPTSLHKVDSAPKRHWHMNTGPAQCSLILCRDLNSGKNSPRCLEANRSSGPMLPLLLTVKSANWCYIPSAPRLDDQGGTKTSVSYALPYICNSVFLKYIDFIISWPALCLTRHYVQYLK